MSERKFDLVGGRGIRCDGECHSYWSDEKPSFAINTSKLSKLGVELFYGCWRRGREDGTASIQYCWYGETGSTEEPGQSKRPDLKQKDGWTPRVCLVHEHDKIRDAYTKEELS